MMLFEWTAASRYRRFLEAEVERLRAELDQVRKQNWALVNSLVTTAGAPLPQEILRGAEASAARANGDPAARGKPPIRKRSWHQIARIFEARAMTEAGPGSAGPSGPDGNGKQTENRTG